MRGLFLRGPLAWAWLALSAASVVGQRVDLQVTEALREMAAQGARFQPDGLHELGLPGLSALLDRLLPDTADESDAGLPPEAVAELIEQLGDERFYMRQSATAELTQLGPVITRPMLKAARHADAEVSWRAMRILRAWQFQTARDAGRQVAAFAVYRQGVEDAPRLEELARRAKLALDSGVPDGARRELLGQCLAAVARSGEDRHCDHLTPLLRHEDVRVAVLVVDMVGAALDRGYFPKLLLDALWADRAEVVAAAVRWTPDCRDGVRRAEVERRLTALFEGDNEELRFHAGFALMHGFHHRAAEEYIRLQVQGGDKRRVFQVIGRLGDSSNRGRQASANLLRIFRPLLEADDPNVRLAAARALAVYTGDEVVKSLVPLLDDSKASIATEVSYRLLQQRDREMLRRVLAAAAKDDPNERIRKKVGLILQRLNPQR